MKIKHIWSVLVQKVIIEAQTNALSLIGVMEELNVGVNRGVSESDKKGIINIPITYEVVSYLTKGEEKGDVNPTMQIQIINPDGKLMKSFEHIITWESEKERMRAKVSINGLAVDIAGNYLFKIGLKERKNQEYREVAELPLKVSIINEPAPTPGKGN